jgi:hypothetical protein
MPQATIDQDVMNRGFEVQGALAVEGLHRTVKLGNLRIAPPNVPGSRCCNATMTSIG